MLKLQVVIGSTREGRNADPVVKWLLPMVKATGAFEVETLDLREWPLPMFQEVVAKMGDLFKSPTFSDPLVTRWNAKIKEADAYLFVTPEYNHSVPGVLKNAIDSVFMTFGFRNKPAAFAAYSNGITGGVRAVEHLNQIMVEAGAVPVRTPALVPMVTAAFDAQGQPTNPQVIANATVMLEDLAWLGNALKPAREKGELGPPSFRARALVTKLTAHTAK
ncbi:MAG: NAD(P)H-dependent oxidoreductase [Myxococcaceae bacterium]